ncbi:MAG TPA: hypothetical protein VFC19_00285 [Candidatus Limnocylindrales bacterium]|nr:hypothetical protein [Candidatus Limnocylindrales bacterium]
MALLQAGVAVRPTVAACAATTAIKRGNSLVAARQIRHTRVLIRRGRYHLYWIVGTVMLVAGSWAG